MTVLVSDFMSYRQPALKALQMHSNKNLKKEVAGPEDELHTYLRS